MSHLPGFSGNGRLEHTKRTSASGRSAHPVFSFDMEVSPHDSTVATLACRGYESDGDDGHVIITTAKVGEHARSKCRTQALTDTHS